MTTLFHLLNVVQVLKIIFWVISIVTNKCPLVKYEGVSSVLELGPKMFVQLISQNNVV